MNSIRTCLLLAALLPLPCAAATPNIAVMELGGNTLSPDDLEGLTNRLHSELFKIGAYTVFERSAMDAVLKEQGFQQTGCVAAECAVEAGQIMGVEKIVVGSVDKVGATYSVSLRMVDVATGRIEHTATADCNNCIIDNVLLTTMRDAARALAGIEKEKAAPAAGPETMGSAEEAAAWNGRWTGAATPKSRIVGPFPMCLDITAANGALTVICLDCAGRGKPDTVSGTVSGPGMRFRHVMQVIRTGVSTSDYQGTLKGNTITGTYTSLYTRGRQEAQGEGTWILTRTR